MEERKLLYEAMEKAYKAFNEHIEKDGCDTAYFQLYLTGYVLNSDFHKAQEIRLNPNNTGFDVFQYEDYEEDNG